MKSNGTFQKNIVVFWQTQISINLQIQRDPAFCDHAVRGRNANQFQPGKEIVILIWQCLISLNLKCLTNRYDGRCLYLWKKTPTMTNKHVKYAGWAWGNRRKTSGSEDWKGFLEGILPGKRRNKILKNVVWHKRCNSYDWVVRERDFKKSQANIIKLLIVYNITLPFVTI